MPFLNDARRVTRLAMVVDELSSVLKEDDCHQKLYLSILIPNSKLALIYVKKNDLVNKGRCGEMVSRLLRMQKFRLRLPVPPSFF